MKIQISKRNLIMLLVDTMLINCALFTALLLRFDTDIPIRFIRAWLYMIPVYTIFNLGFFLFFKLYSRLWKYASLEDLLSIGMAATAGMIGVVVSTYSLNLPALPRSVFIMSWILIIVYIGTSRIFRRIVKGYNRKTDRNSRRVLIVGAGSAGALLVREIQSNSYLGIEVIAFIDDDPDKIGQHLLGVPIKGNRHDIPKQVIDLMIEEIIIAMPSIKGPPMRGIINICEQTTASLKILPSFYEHSEGSIISKVRQVRMEDLLSRFPVRIELDTVCGYLQNKTVLVTGGGGSIGSELCRQILNFSPKKLVIMDSSENNLFEIDWELKDNGFGTKISTELIDIKNVAQLEIAFKNHRPQVVFHAAAYKHVPMMEQHPEAALTNNVLGTRNVAFMANQYHCETFILISTDKAVNPTSVMGASKRMAELVMKDISRNSKTNYAAVRFGNVLGSRGSVIPTFEKQIENGGPVTVTHPNMKRYFMTIPEAVQLVLQAGALTKGGEIFVLDMGEPVKIDDLARDLIRLYGLEPDVDIPIVYTGIRPGEKLYEELFSNSEEMEATRHERIFISRRELKSDYIGMNKQLDEWVNTNYFNREAIIDLFYDIVPEYKRTKQSRIVPFKEVKGAG